ncbi:uncharacterized protein LOC126817013 [Patella vulgata]|uniref:uncharacterized protein LOC126817013 n=1 Tax=Patella vulgata TaxID=6465 RepID=UPI0024A98DA3|nr:uncharacterized protein LOC126817013 [Patella vulgata]XP_055955881.1 uncharacterized protein LOC126817013 [Patella vulgata]
MISTTLSCLLFVVFIAADEQIAFSKPIIETQYDIVRVEEILSNQRSKRSTDGDLPKTMFFHIRSEKTDAKLRLRRAPKIEIPTFVCGNGTIHSVEIEDFKKHGIFLDDDTGRPIMVSNRGRYYDLLGSVKINDTHLNLQPIEGGLHNLTTFEAVSYGADMLVGEGVNLERIKDVAKIMKRKKRRVRNKRQANVYTVEVLVVTDHSVKEKFMERNNNYESMADSELKTYYGFTLLGMAVRYESITRFEPDTVINIEGSGIIISNTEDDSPYNRDNSDKGVVQYFSGLVHFTDWVDANTNNGYLPAHDHAMWFTEYV